MEDDNGIELSLGLSFGGTACNKSRSKDGSSLDINNTEDGAEKKDDDVMGDLKNFLTTTNIPPQGSDDGPKMRSSDTGHTTQENFFTNLGKSASVVDDSSMAALHGTNNTPQFVKYGGLWDPNGKTIKIEEENHEVVGQRMWPEASSNNKRKGLFEEMNRQKKKHEREVHADEHDKTPATVVVNDVKKTSSVSDTTGNGLSTASEDAAESRAEGSISRGVSHHEGGSKPDVGGGSSRTAPKENHGFTNSSVIDFQGQNSFDVLPGNESKGKNLAFGDPFSLQPLMTVPYSGIVDSATAASSKPGFHMPSMIQLVPPTNREGQGNQLAIPAVIQVSGSSEALLDERNASELTKGSGKQYVVEEAGACASSQLADGIKESNMIYRSKEAFQQIVVQGFSPEGSAAIKPGIAAGLKFGGSGSYPDLPWVCTRSPEPNGRTISGVTYKYDKNQIKIICACHGSHMSPEEFVQHASADQQPNPENNTGGLTSYSSSNPATSAKS